MGITNITSISDTECETSKIITKNFMNEIKNKKYESNANLENSSNQQDTKYLQMNFLATFSKTFDEK